MSPFANLAVIAILAGAPLTAAVGDTEPLTPFPDARITAEDLETYRAGIEALPGIECADIWAHQRKCDDPKTRSMWIFTLAGHPAHPAFSRARLYYENGQLGITRALHFAGDESEFQKWAAEFKVLDQRQVDEFARMLSQ